MTNGGAGWEPYPGAEPLPEAYGRLSNRKRFAKLHHVATRTVERLCNEFEVERDDNPLLPTWRPEMVVRAVRLAPSGGGAPITVVCTTFPGVHVAFGESHTWGYPSCGCDACNEGPDDLADELEADVTAVALGQFVEYRNRKGETGYRIDYVDDERRGNGYKAGTPPGRLVERRWPAWRRR